tara:strand:+ start:469 stop:1266 length:798 start_codon:yes stop_codon:yes gene_type:complete
MRPIVLFDMDGTLTPVRQKIQPEMISSLLKLSMISDIGIVTGSGQDYLREQCNDLINHKSPGLKKSITLLPCNGTQKLTYNAKKKDWNLDSAVKMIDELSKSAFDKLIKVLLELQLEVASKEEYSMIPLTGNFISYRGSMINWCPMGRDASLDDRQVFEKADKKFSLRKGLVDKFETSIRHANICGIVSALGGNTSIDIYPTGWDKTYSLRHVNSDSVWFVGDRCLPGENDYSLYQYLKSDRRSFRTSSPQETSLIIKDIISLLP